MWAKIKKRLYLYKAGGEELYHYSIEFFIEQVIKHLRRKTYDLIIIENRPVFALKLKEVTTAPLVYHIHNENMPQNLEIANSICQAANLIICVSDYITNYTKKISSASNKCVTVHNGICTSILYDAIRSNRKEFKIYEEDFVIAYIGRLTKEKGILQLIQAIKRLKDIHDLKLMIIGASAYGKDKRPTSFIKQLEEEITPIKERVIFTGFIEYSKVPSYLKMADIAIVPSMWEEPFGLTVVEAMAAGLPLITTRSGGIPEICEGVATIVNRDNIVENLANAILDLYHNPEKRVAMSKASLERSKMFDKETYARNFFEAIKDIHP
jgi:glycosyltransferase involved in cell wall biosynthesis